MKIRKALLAALIIAVVLMVALLSTKEYYIAIALGVEVLIVFRREIWHLGRYRRLPPFDERFQENANKAARNSFIYMSVAAVFLMLAYALNISYVVDYEPLQVFSWLLISGGLVYLLGYAFYDRVEPKLRKRELKRYWAFLRITGIAFGTGITSAILHNAVSSVLGLEEPVFFIIAVILAPVAFVTGLIGSLVIFSRGLIRRQLHESPK